MMLIKDALTDIKYARLVESQLCFKQCTVVDQQIGNGICSALFGRVFFDWS